MIVASESSCLFPPFPAETEAEFVVLAASPAVPGGILVLVKCSDRSSAHVKLCSGEHQGTAMTAHPYSSLMKLSSPGYCSGWQGMNVAITRLFYVDPGGVFAPWL